MFIIFDLDDTLLDTSATAGRFQLERAAQLLKTTLSPVESEETIAQELIQARPHHATGGETIFAICRRHQWPEEVALRAVDLYYHQHPPTLRVTMRGQAKEMLEELRRQRHRMALISIGRIEQQRRKMTQAGLDPAYFDYLEIVETADKSLAYRRVLEHWNLCPDQQQPQVVVVGDREETDLNPGRAMGMRLVLLGKGPHCQAIDARIQELRELLPLLTKWEAEAAAKMHAHYGQDAVVEE